MIMSAMPRKIIKTEAPDPLLDDLQEGKDEPMVIDPHVSLL